MIIRSNVCRERQENYPSSVRRDVREPVVELIVGDLLLVASVGVHPPDLHAARSSRVEVDEASVGSELGSVVQSLRGSEPDLVSTSNVHLVDIEVAVSLRGVDH